jgi:hypothetical protein
MRRNWIGIRASAVLSILGSAVTLLFAGLMLFAGFFTPPPASPSPIPLKPVMAAMAAVFVALGAWGISTAVAIFLRRRWARASMLVFAVLLTFMGASAMVTLLFVPLPAPPQSDAAALMPAFRWGIAAFYGVLAAIGVWWLVLFNRSRTKEYFAGQAPVTESARPLSVGMIAWFLLIGVACMAALALLRFPAMLFGVVLKGGAAFALYVVFAAVQIYCGAGLLRLRERARVATIGYICFTTASGVVSLISPGYAEMMRQIETTMPKLFPAGAPTTLPGAVWATLLTAAFWAVFLFFLVRCRSAFERS